MLIKTTLEFFVDSFIQAFQTWLFKLISESSIPHWEYRFTSKKFTYSSIFVIGVFSKTFNIVDLEIARPYDNNFDKKKIIDKAFVLAFKELISKLTISEDSKNLKTNNLKVIESLVDSFTIVDEQIIKKKYIAKFEVNFNKKQIKTAVNFILENKKFSIIRIDGEIGSGKTTIIKALSESLGVTENVSSPTYSLVNEYFINKKSKIFHFDFFRLKDSSEALDIGLEDYLESNHLCILEFAL